MSECYGDIAVSVAVRDHVKGFEILSERYMKRIYEVIMALKAWA